MDTARSMMTTWKKSAGAPLVFLVKSFFRKIPSFESMLCLSGGSDKLDLSCERILTRLGVDLFHPFCVIKTEMLQDF